MKAFWITRRVFPLENWCYVTANKSSVREVAYLDFCYKFFEDVSGEKLKHGESKRFKLVEVKESSK